MAAFWHPLSTVLLTDPLCLATPVLLQTVLAGDGTAEMLYAGDRMWRAARHGDRLTVDPPSGRDVGAGTVVVVSLEGIPDLLRVATVDGDALSLVADADADLRASVRPEDLLAVARLPRRRTSSLTARIRRVLLDCREALTGSPDAADDPALTVLHKYDSQADSYSGSMAQDLEPGLEETTRRSVKNGGRILVVGSGAGRECFGLAQAGFVVTGLDFSPAMIERSRSEARRRGLPIEFRLGDVRRDDLGEARYDAVLFTYDVYSFLPRREARISALKRMWEVLTPEGRLILSARRLQSAYGAWLLTLQWLASGGRREWGDSHTRWITGEGELRRSFVHLFSSRGLAAEIDAGGFELESWRRGHGVLARRLL